MSRYFSILCILVICGSLIYFGDTSLGIADSPGKECGSFNAWITSKSKIQPELEPILPPPENISFSNTSNVRDVAWSGTAKDILDWAGWPYTRMKFALFKPYSYNQLLNTPNLQTGAFLIIIPGPSSVRKLNRRQLGEPWITASPATLAEFLPLKALETLASALEMFLLHRRFEYKPNMSVGRISSRGNDSDGFTVDHKGLHKFHIEVAPSKYSFPLCRGRGGACAIWEGSTGRVIIDSEVAARLGSSPTLATFLDKFTVAFTSLLNVGIDSEDGVEYPSSVEAIGKFISKAATAAISAVLLSRSHPLWWCFVCPIVLGLLAPFAINFGLTAAAEQLCATLKLPAAECSDLWWAAFALAMVLSLGSAVPIVYVCRLPDCIKRALDSN